MPLIIKRVQKFDMPDPKIGQLVVVTEGHSRHPEGTVLGRVTALSGNLCIYSKMDGEDDCFAWRFDGQGFPRYIRLEDPE